MKAWIIAAAVLMYAAAVRAEQVVYASNFAAEADARWSSDKTSTSPNGNSVFLGRFVNTVPRLTLTDLPPHQYVRVKLRLLILLSWDGQAISDWGARPAGPDFWRMSLGDGRVLFWHSFSNIDTAGGDAESPSYFQSYPSPVPGERCAARSGAAQRDTLGFVFGSMGPMDTTYEITLTFPHVDPELRIDFTARGLQPGGRDEAWGIESVEVSVLAAGELKAPDRQGSGELLEQSAGEDAAAGDEAFVQLLLGGEAVREAMNAALAAAGIDRGEVERLSALAAADENAFDDVNDQLQLLAGGAALELGFWRAWAMTRSSQTRGHIEEVLRLGPAEPLSDPLQRKAAVAARVLLAVEPGAGDVVQAPAEVP